MRSHNYFEGYSYMLTVEFSSNESIQNCMKTEFNIIHNVSNASEKNVIDVGAGYGRLMPFLSASFKKVHGIEIEEKMFRFLNVRNKQFINCVSYHHDFFNSYELIKKTEDIINVFILAQNTIGTMNKSLDKVTDYLIKLLKPNDELIITFFKAETLENIGLNLYISLSSMLGNPDFNKTSFSSGEYYSDTGYYSKWMSSEEINLFIERINARLIEIKDGSFYKIIHFKL